MFKLSKFFLASIIIFTLQISSSEASLMVHPKRIQFDKYSPKFQEIILNNRSNTKESYRISFINMRMDKNGKYKRITAKQARKGERFAGPFIRFSPKRVVLKGKQSQVIRLMLRRGKNFKDGEYRSHILIQQEAPADFGKTINKKKKNDKSLNVTLKALFGISMPVIIKYGKLEHEVKITNIKISKNKKGKEIAGFDLNRFGNESVFGNLEVYFDPKGLARSKKIGELTSVAIYSPYKKRKMRINLNIPKKMKGKTGTLTIKYLVKDKSHKKKQYSIASKSLTL
jgi:hypothetical protein